MRICKIWDADYPWDIRVEKVTKALVEAGHSVALVCRNQARRVRNESAGNFTIHRLPAMPLALGPLHAICNFPLPINPFWIHAIAKTIRVVEADLILVRDLPLALPAVLLGKMYRIPVVLDMAENYPAMLEDRLRYTPTGPLGRIARHPATARVIERLTIRLVDHIIVVTEESRDRLIQEGVSRERLSIVSNTPKAGLWTVNDSARVQAENHSKGLELVYLGNLDGIRGIDVAIRAVRLLKDMNWQATLTIIGDGPTMSQLRGLALQLEVTDRVSFMGRMSIDNPSELSELQAIMARSHIGLIPHFATEACNTTIPNKLFDYMSMGLPVVVSNMPPTERVVLQEECGEVFQDRDAEDLARCITRLADPRVRKIKGANGLAAVEKRFNWDYDSQVLVKTIESIGSHQISRPMTKRQEDKGERTSK